MDKHHLEQYILKAESEFDRIPPERKVLLHQLTASVHAGLKGTGKSDLLFICTHNSRRSHLAQVWAQVAAFHYRIKTINTYSGGTEVTAMFPMIANTLEKAGLKSQKHSEGDNPVYAIKYHPNEPAIVTFSKTYDDPFNVQTGFVAVMTCSQADEYCPFIPPAEQRISLPFEDPKAYDNTPHQEVKYDERCRDIAREMLFVFSNLNKP